MRRKVITALAIMVIILVSGLSCVQVLAQESTETSSLEESVKDGLRQRIQTEKEYLLEAMDYLEEKGLSPVAIWSKITNDESVLQALQDAAEQVSGVVTDTVHDTGEELSEKVNEIGSEVTQQIDEALEEETEKAKQNLIERFREWLENLF